MNKSSSVDSGIMIFYTLEGAKGEDPQHPNAFLLDSVNEVPTLGEIRKRFPLQGHFHFSFKTKLKRFVIRIYFQQMLYSWNTCFILSFFFFAESRYGLICSEKMLRYQL